jgi:hypothetical protein
MKGRGRVACVMSEAEARRRADVGERTRMVYRYVSQHKASNRLNFAMFRTR